MENILIFTDGSSRGNPGSGGWGAVVVANQRVIELGDGEAHTTNNRMEMQAVISAINFLIEYELLTQNFKCVVHTDSAYVINGITKWVSGWKARGWLTLQKEQVLNRDLWEKMSYLLEAMPGDEKIEWKLLKGHVGVAGNERCDEIATTFADKKEIKLYDGPLSGYSIDIASVSQDADKTSARSESKKRSSKKAYSYISRIGGKIEVHKTWAECEARVKGASGAKFKKSLSKADEQVIIAEFSK
ncbi:TPA: ribonuclease HI [Candidatus Taylorbacteria bacterium]|nr:ribonuclease HI [Candidatus Taylorbacteria bacterium]